MKSRLTFYVSRLTLYASRITPYVSRLWWVFLLLALLASYWLLPIAGQVIVVPGTGSRALLWPQMYVAAVRTMAQGERLWTVEQLARVRRWREEVEQRWKSLTEREREVLLLVATGKSNREIADRLCITVKTVEKHVSNVLGKLMLVSRTEVALWAVKTGLVSV